VMDAEEHDSYVAAVSHMPMVAATTLFALGRSSAAWPELSLLAAGGFNDMTRLAATDPDMAYDIVVTNRDNVAHWIDRYVDALSEFKRRLMDMESEDDLYRLLAATESDYLAYRNGKVGREVEGQPEPPDTGGMIDFLAGGWLRERFEQAMNYSEERGRKADEEVRSRRRV
ncbi:MAG: prephenate dehydrogenase dimerization domain-containing protein, partial [Dehalococcoidia bacterium]